MHLGLEVAVDVAELVQLRDGAEHLGDVEPRVLLLEDARVVEERAEVAAGDEVLRGAKDRWSVGRLELGRAQRHDDVPQHSID